MAPRKGLGGHPDLLSAVKRDSRPAPRRWIRPLEVMWEGA